jgi:hypothetical protein
VSARFESGFTRVHVFVEAIVLAYRDWMIGAENRRRDQNSDALSPILARLRHAECIEECPLSGVTGVRRETGKE